MEPDYLEKIKKQIQKGTDVKGYWTFILLALMIFFMVNLGLDNPVGKAIEPEETKTCGEIKGVCSIEPCFEGYAEKDNSCPDSQYCCKKEKQ